MRDHYRKFFLMEVGTMNSIGIDYICHEPYWEHQFSMPLAIPDC